MRQVLRAVGSTKEEVKCYSSHACRVGGSNFMRRLGISDKIHQRMGGWYTLTSARGYMQLEPGEQFQHTAEIKRRKKPGGFTTNGNYGKLKGKARARATIKMAGENDKVRHTGMSKKRARRALQSIKHAIL